MTKINPCGCGYFLEIGTRIVLRLTAMFKAAILGLSLKWLKDHDYTFDGVTLGNCILVYLMIDAIVGIVISLRGYCVFTTENAKFLNAYISYSSYSVITGVSALLIILALNIFTNSSYLSPDIYILVLLYMAICAYFGWVVKSYRDELQKTDAQHEDV